jgi:uncharacterized protein YdaU (DUF1376 family)
MQTERGPTVYLQLGGPPLPFTSGVAAGDRAQMKNPWVAWYPGDYINKTRGLTMSQHGAYTLLLWEYYINGPILANATYPLNVCLASASEQKADVEFVLNHFFTKRDGKWHHERADKEREKRDNIRKTKEEQGRLGGLAKARNSLERNTSGTLACSQSHINLNPKPPYPPFSKGGQNGNLTPREHKKVTAELQRIGQASIGTEIDDRVALQTACARAGVDFERAKYLLNGELA